MSEKLRSALREYADTIWLPTSTFLIQSERSRGMSPQAIVVLFWRRYRHVGFYGCSRHSGRRTFITNTARKIPLSAGL
jgi:integrase/recombinase XerD